MPLTTLAALHWILLSLSTSLLNWDGPKSDMLFQVQPYQEPLPWQGDNSFLWLVGHVHRSKVTQYNTYLACDKSSLLAHIHDSIHLNSQVLYNRPCGWLALPCLCWYMGLFHTTCRNLSFLNLLGPNLKIIKLALDCNSTFCHISQLRVNSVHYLRHWWMC